MKKIAAADVVIFGGGVAGLWLLNYLRKTGLSAILFESNAIGGGQTNKSQGIIHGGMKYTLKGVFNKEASALADMPSLWRQFLSGQGEIDLSHVPILSEQQFLWAPNKFTAKMAGFLASNTLSSKVSQVAKANYPSVFQAAIFKGEVYALNEVVVDVPALVSELLKQNQDAIFSIEPLNEESLKIENGKLVSATVYAAGQTLEITAQQFIFTAGAGNEVIVKKLQLPELNMQRRPLHMVLVKTPFDYPLYAHCMGLDPRPRVTITTHYTNDGKPVWYIGGQLSEEGVQRDSEAQIQATREELQTLFPWLNFAGAEYATLRIDRAEPKQKNGLKPETAYFKAIENIIIAWPTKLAFAPQLAADIIAHLQKIQLTPHLADLRELRIWPLPPIAIPIWEEAFCKHVA